MREGLEAWLEKRMDEISNEVLHLATQIGSESNTLTAMDRLYQE